MTHKEEWKWIPTQTNMSLISGTNVLEDIDLDIVQPYMYEQEGSTSSESEDPNVDPESRLMNTNCN